MSDESTDTTLPLKKRARRRLIGAVVFAGLAAVILPMVMDEEPKQQVQDVQIRIPDPDRTPFRPRLDPPEPRPVEPARAPEPRPPAEPPRPPEPVRPPEIPKPVEPPRPAAKPVEPPKPAPAPAAKPAQADAERAAAILSGKTDPTPAPSGQFVILIGAYANPANVTQLQSKFEQIGIKSYTEPLDAPDGKRTRVRAGPFPNRAAAEKALEKMKRIGVNGVIAPRQ